MTLAAAEAEVILRDGSTVHVRPVAPEDRDRMRAFLGSLSESSRRLRYFSGGANLDWAAAAAIEVGFPGSYSIVATRGDGKVATPMLTVKFTGRPMPTSNDCDATRSRDRLRLGRRRPA